MKRLDKKVGNLASMSFEKNKWYEPTFNTIFIRPNSKNYQ